MGPVNWIAVIVAWAVAALLGVLVYGRAALPPPDAPGGLARHAVAALLLAFTATMMGHMFARVGAAELAGKPWLYPMMSGGLALAFAGPALFITYTRRAAPLRVALIDWGYWLAAYLLMGAAFWALR